MPCAPVDRHLIMSISVLPLILLEIAQIGWRLVLHRWHQQAIGAEIVHLIADADMCVVFTAHGMAEPDRLVIWGAPVGLVDRPRPR